MKLIRNEKGVTLVEVLAAMVILTIILGTIMNFFPQMGFMNKTNEDKSQAINTAKQVLIEWQNDDGVQNFLNPNGTGTLPTIGTRVADVTISNGTDLNGTYYHFLSTEGDFGLDIFIKKTPDLGNLSDTNSIKAYLTKIQVSNTKGTVITETYGYIML